MAGPVTYHTKDCPNGVKGFGGVVSKVGSTNCQMCQHYGGIVEHKTEQGEVLFEGVHCNHGC